MNFYESIEKRIPLIGAVMALLLTLLLVPASNTFQEEVKALTFRERVVPFLGYVVQVFIVIFSYYFYYHIHHRFLIKKILKQKGLLFYILGLMILVVVVPPLHNMLILFFPYIESLKIHPLGFDNNVFSFFNYSFAISTLVLTFPLIVIMEWYAQQHRVNTLEKEKTQVELSMLKQQINPHFFFNTLNNLYAMSLTNDEATPETILKLSDLMRYVIYKGKEEKVKLSQEINYLRDYLDLQMIRLQKKVDLKFEVQTTNEDLEIVPLLFIILLENAFKHGVEPAEENCYLHVEILQNKNELIFSCKNSVEADVEKTPKGIGLENLKRRLELIYPNQYDLEIDSGEKDYTAKLKLNI